MFASSTHRLQFPRPHHRTQDTHMATNNISGGVYGYIFRGRRYDTGDKLDYIKAIVRLALQRDDLGPLLEQWLDVESHRRK